jgi:FAD/FMN-containing dehydrogenase
MNIAIHPQATVDADRLVALRADLGDVPLITDEAQLRQKSRDFFWFSPILKEELDHCRADLVALPRDRNDLVRIARACARHRIPLTVRGGGTGNYGQAMPLEGGVVVDMGALGATRWVRPGVGRFEAGARMLDIDRTLRGDRQELRFHPSTRAHATIGGFLAGGAGGVGSCTWGQLADRGAVIAVEVLTVEEEPRFIELRGRDALKVMHAYGVNGIITEVEMPLAPWHPWAERICAFDTLEEVARFAHALTAAEGIAKKLVSVHDGRISPLLKRIRPFVPDGKAMVILMVSEPQAPTVEDMAAEFGGETVFARGNEEVEAATFDGQGKLPPLYEYTWNHTTLYALKAKPGTTYLQVRYPAGREIEIVTHLAGVFGEEVLFHLEFQRRFGRVFVSSLPLVQYTTRERLEEIVRMIEAAGAELSNPHTYRLSDAGWKKVDAPQASFKREADPHGLMNPGKLLS